MRRMLLLSVAGGGLSAYAASSYGVVVAMLAYILGGALITLVIGLLPHMHPLKKRRAQGASHPQTGLQASPAFRSEAEASPASSPVN